ncbi:hypothetical protein [Rhodoferax koreensis]|nr:hypothetical protein [Rhodoferax koreense]
MTLEEHRRLEERARRELCWYALACIAACGLLFWGYGRLASLFFSTFF